MANHDKIDPKIYELITKLGISRDKLEEYCSELEGMKVDVQAIFPKGNDFRNKFILDDKLKTASTFASSILAVRKEINDTIIKEIELRRKVVKDEGDEGMSNADLRDLIDAIDKHKPQFDAQAALDMQEVETLDKREEEVVLTSEEFAKQEGIDLGETETNSETETEPILENEKDNGKKENE